jgi:hypothetical protein
MLSIGCGTRQTFEPEDRSRLAAEELAASCRDEAAALGEEDLHAHGWIGEDGSGQRN